jgi:serine/threonine protein kinase/dienelactone hydrolase
VDKELTNIKSIFWNAIEKKTTEERVAYLDQMCASSLDLRIKIENLLKLHDNAGDFLESPIIDPDVTLNDLPQTEGPGAEIGNYKLLERIGEGGMALVYMAEQTKPIRRKVALKIIKLGMDTKSVIARFEAERQALAMMDHPNIAKVLDAGATETGRPYFVMELVTGISITEYCDKNNLSTKDRLTLFIQVCNAVQHAHQKGIIHRDIKPSNVMIEHHDGKPVPKVIDFGIAKAINQKLTEKTLFTRYAHIIGTPAYMSPEQAELSALGIDTRSDIYSLGILLYELLTGTTPFGEEELRKAGYIEMQRVIREQEPPKPSTKLSTLGKTLTDVAKHRSATPDILRKAIRGDLDWIVMKSLEKDRARRYETANGMVLDVRRHLEHEPVLARPPSTIYRLRKFIHRNRLRVAVSLAGALLVGGIISTVIMYRRIAKLQWAKVEALPRVIELIEKEDYQSAFSLAKEVEELIPKDSTLKELWPKICTEFSVTTMPAGADVYFREVLAQDGPWQYLGHSPLQGVRLPRGVYRWRFEKSGHEPRECVAADKIEVLLQEKGDHPEMVRIGSQTYGSYLIDKFEVTNEQFKRFVDAGGYRNKEYWAGLTFVKEDHNLTWDQAVKEFCDRTGKPGPWTWEEGSYPEGKELHPVSGISWYEAVAFARFAGKNLPTIHHWFEAAQTHDVSLLFPQSNFGRDSAPVGSYPGMGRHGLYDMAGNVREWCWNSTDEVGTQHYILGGDWADPTYTFLEGDIRSPWDRSIFNGVRCALYHPEDEKTMDSLLRPYLPCPPRDISQIEPLTKEELPDLFAYYDYDHTPLNPTVEQLDDSSPIWRKEKISFDAAYGGERIAAYLFLPKRSQPPYQTVVYFPGGQPLYVRSFEGLPYEMETEFIIANGRALLYPVYKGTYDRPRTPSGDWSPESFRRTPMMYRDWIIQLSKDVGRSLDYLETRLDIDHDKIAYYGVCWGGFLGFIIVPAEERFKASILVSGGLPKIDVALPRFIEPAVLAQAVKIPVLMLNGTEESRSPLKTSQVPAYTLLGTAKEHKQHKLYPGGDEFYSMFQEQVHSDILDWLERYLGPAESK